MEPPSGDELPARGFDRGNTEQLGFSPPPKDGSDIEVNINPDSDRIQVLTPFKKFDGQDYIGLKVLMKAEGKCTTDHISQAGPWLKYRGHLENISMNLFLGANNAFTPSGEILSLPELAKSYKSGSIQWIAVGDSNYGEGSSREHAAMEPRFMNGVVILVRSFARIHEANLKKQGVLPLTFADPSDYELIRFDDDIDVVGLNDLAPGKQVSINIRHSDGTQDSIQTNQTMSEEHISWFKAGSALNVLRGG